MKVYQYDEMQLAAFANQVKDTVLRGLAKAGEMREEDAERMSCQYAVVVMEPSKLSHVWARILGKEKADELRIVVMENLDGESDWNDKGRMEMDE